MVSYLEWVADGDNTVQFIAVITHNIMTSFLRQTVKQHSTAILAILVPVSHGPFVHFIIVHVLETNL